MNNKLGTVVYWQPFPGNSAVKDVQAKLTELGLDPLCAREPKDRNAFIRAVHKAEAEHIVRRVGDESHDELVFQFTKEFLDAQRLDYRYEAQVKFIKATGAIECEAPGILSLVQGQFGYASEHFLPRDMTAIMQRTFRKQADLLPLREGGAVYFVPARYDSVVAALREFAATFGSDMGNIVVPAGDEPSRKTVYAAFLADANDAVVKLSVEVDEVVATTSNADGVGERSLHCRMKKVRKMLARVQVYEDTLSEAAGSVRGSVAAIQKKLENALTK